MFYFSAPLRDMSIQEWLERKQCNEDVIALFEAMYCQTVAATPKQMGLFESAREENAWQYGSGNYRWVSLNHPLIDQRVISPCSIRKLSSRQVMRITKLN